MTLTAGGMGTGLRWAVTAGLVAGAVVLARLAAASPGAALHPLAHYGVRLALVIVALAAWFWTQSLIGTRPLATDATAIGDRLHDATAPLHRLLAERPRLTDRILIASSAGIDLFGLYLIGTCILGPSIRPFVALLALFAFRQLCQALCALPAPRGMLWRHPGFPSLFVTYGVAGDFFISGHTAVAVLGAIEIARVAPAWVGVAAGVVACLEGAVVIVLRAHYTMDVLGAVTAAWCAAELAARLGA